MVLHRYWLHLSTIVLGLALPSWASFENTGVTRSVDLGGALVHTTTTYNVKALEDGSNVYVFALTEREQETTSWIEAKVKGDPTPLSLENHGLSDEYVFDFVWFAWWCIQVAEVVFDSATYYYSVVLPKALEKGQTASLVLGIVQTHAAHPFPPEAAQNDRQVLKYDTDLFVSSPYKTHTQRTKFKSVDVFDGDDDTAAHHFFAPSTMGTPIKDYTQPDEVAFTTGNIATKSTTGGAVTYGPFSNIPPSSNTGFAEKHQQKISIHYEFGFPVLAIKNLRRTAEISHWGANLNIQDEIHLYNAGPK